MLMQDFIFSIYYTYVYYETANGFGDLSMIQTVSGF